MTYGPDVGGDEDDDGERTKPGVANGEANVARNIGAGEVMESEGHHAHGQGQRYQVKHPHFRRRGR